MADTDGYVNVHILLSVIQTLFLSLFPYNAHRGRAEKSPSFHRRTRKESIEESDHWHRSPPHRLLSLAGNVTAHSTPPVPIGSPSSGQVFILADSRRYIDIFDY